MKPGLEFEGKNVDNAVKKACEQLNISKNQLKYDVLSNGSSGIFGLVGFKKARIRVIGPELELRNFIEETPDKTSAMTSYKGVQSLVDEAFSDKKPLAKEQRKAKETPSTKPEPQPKQEHQDPEKPPVSIPEKITAPKENSAELDANLIKGKEALQTIIKSITTDAQVSIEQDNERVLYKVEGGNSAVLIGKRGQTLEAIQYIIDKIVNKPSEKRLRIQIDVEGYLESRKATLERLALKLSEKTKRTGKPSTINQMNAHDRRIVHIALKEDKEVRTQSVGNGYYRKLVIFPKKQYKPKKKAPKKA